MPPAEEDPWSDKDNGADFVDPFAQPSQGGGDLGGGGLDAAGGVDSWGSDMEDDQQTGGVDDDGRPQGEHLLVAPLP